MLSTSISVTGSSPPATHKRSSRTSSREITFRNVDHIHESSANQIGRSNYGGRVSVSPQSGNGIKKAEHIEAFIKEHKFKPIIMKKIAWNEPAQPAIREDYFSSLIGPEMDADKAVEIVDRMQKRVDRLDEETVSHVSSVLLEMVKLANELSGMDNTLTKREALLVCMGFKTGEAYVCGKYGINE
nr:MAG: hypothetical protein [Bacteriophage sp.]